jgi:hypothetical protein
MPTPDELRRLLDAPNETLAIEYKSWLSIADNAGKATLAKAAIALANHGGGTIVLGMRADAQQEGVLASHPRPAGLPRYTQDDINAAINRFADPPMHCDLLFARHRATQTEHAFVIVPSDLATPAMSKRDCEGVIAAQRAYIRKPGPRSEEPFTGAEWRALFDRCIRAGRESMLDAIRHIVQGQAGAVPAEDALARLGVFTRASRDRWQRLINQLPADDPARMPHGCRELAFEIRDVPPAPTLAELRRRLEAAEAIRLTGWHPFLSLNREPFACRVVDGLIETWLGPEEEKRARRDPAHCDFWRASLDGRLCIIRGYEEDNPERRPPGTLFDVALPIWRVAEPLLHVARLARQFGDAPSIVMTVRHTGLANRRLGSIDNRRHFFDNRRAADDTVELALTANVAEVEDNLAELMHRTLAPLYEGSISSSCR